MEKITNVQLGVLRWISEGCPNDLLGLSIPSAKGRARALANRKLVVIDNSYRGWSAEITEAGTYYLEHEDYPPGHKLHNLDLTPVPREPRPEEAVRPEAAPEPTAPAIDSPRRLRERAEQEELSAKDRMRKAKNPTGHPWDDKVLVSVKEAAWLLSLSISMIGQAARDGDIERVYIGEGTRSYRIVYQSLLAWVDGMPRESPNDY